MTCRWMQLYVRIEEMVEKLTEMNLKPERKTLLSGLAVVHCGLSLQKMME